MRRRMQLTDTNRSRTYPNTFSIRMSLSSFEGTTGSRCCPVTTAKRSHPFPCRTRKLSSCAPMIIGGRPPVKVGRCRATASIFPHFNNVGRCFFCYTLETFHFITSAGWMMPVYILHKGAWFYDIVPCVFSYW